MHTYPQQELSKFRQNQKFTWNNRIYTVFQHEKGMTEVFESSNAKFWAWNSYIKVIPITFE